MGVVLEGKAVSYQVSYADARLLGRTLIILDCSALYVVDLVRFRLVSFLVFATHTAQKGIDLKFSKQMAAGDVLRSHYHQLSADPNSLSNLDQGSRLSFSSMNSYLLAGFYRSAEQPASSGPNRKTVWALHAWTFTDSYFLVFAP